MPADAPSSEGNDVRRPKRRSFVGLTCTATVLGIPDPTTKSVLGIGTASKIHYGGGHRYFDYFTQDHKGQKRANEIGELTASR